MPFPDTVICNYAVILLFLVVYASNNQRVPAYLLFKRYAFLSKVFPAISTKTTEAISMTATSIKRGKSAPILPVSNGKIMFFRASIP